jgi:putative transposase
MQLRQQDNFVVSVVCEVLELPRSTFYYTSKPAEEADLVEQVKAVAGAYPTYGSRRITHQLRRSPYQIVVNRKRVQRIMRQNLLLLPAKRRKCRTTNSEHPYPRYPNLVKDRVVSHPDQVWASDITYIRLESEFVYLAIILDIFTRSVRGWCLSRTLDQELSLTALRRALEHYGPAEIHHSDQGVHYAAHSYIRLLRHHNIQISMAAVGKAEENGYAERFMRTIKEEEVQLSEYHDFADAQAQIGQFIEAVYNQKRIHSALDYLSPAEFELAYRLAQTLPQGPSPL